MRKKKKLSKEVIVKIELKQENKEDRITIEMLLDSRMIELIIISECTKKHKFRKKVGKTNLYKKCEWHL